MKVHVSDEQQHGGRAGRSLWYHTTSSTSSMEVDSWSSWFMNPPVWVFIVLLSVGLAIYTFKDSNETASSNESIDGNTTT